MSKNFWFTIIWISILSQLFAQKTYIATHYKGNKPHHLLKAITDTLDSHFDSVTITLYAAPVGGFASGNSGYGEKAKIQEFDVDSSYTVEGFLFWFGYKAIQSSPNDSSAIDFVFYNLDSTANINGIGRFVPKTILEKKKVLLANIDTSVNFSTGINIWMVTPRIVYQNYGVGIRLDKVHIKDTIALYSSSNGDPPIPSLSWEYWQGSWNTMLNNWGLDIDFAIFPLVDLTNLSLDNTAFIQGLKVKAYPNPVNDLLFVDFINTELSELSFTLYDMHGKTVFTKNAGIFSPGSYQQFINVNNIPSGNYILLITNQYNQGIAQRVIIQH
ncbi:MAG: T9SS type A sorting domain-containing protein [Flavobacteriales bacterium]|nr:T9SS type A sorting domain-containing protein [Flavobacteriales bacterium]